LAWPVLAFLYVLRKSGGVQYSTWVIGVIMVVAVAMLGVGTWASIAAIVQHYSDFDSIHPFMC
jgi:hypothetical protein